MKKWENFGDINFLAYGGCLVRQAYTDEEIADNPKLASFYEVFYLYPNPDGNYNENYACLCRVDIDDTRKDRKKAYDLLYAIGCEEKIDCLDEIAPEIWAKEIVETSNGQESLSCESFKTSYAYRFEDYIISDHEVEEWIKDLKIVEDLPDLI